MCYLFRTQDPASYAAETRAIRLHGHSTSIRLEAAFWGILEEIAQKERMTVARFICVLHDEVLAQCDDISNLASLLRVTCAHYLRNQDLHARQIAERLALETAAHEKDQVVA